MSFSIQSPVTKSRPVHSAKSLLLDTSDLFSTIPSNGKIAQSQTLPNGAKGLVMHSATEHQKGISVDFL